MIKKVLGTLAIVALIYSCGTKQKKAENTIEKIKIEDLMANIDNYIDTDIAIGGIVNHVCAHGGKRLFLVSENSDVTIKVIPTEAFGVFNKELEGSSVYVYGIVKELRIDDAYINDLEKEMSEGVESEATHDGNHSGEEETTGIDSSQVQKIAEMRQEVAASGKGYISQYWIECNKIEAIEETGTEVAEKAVEAEK